MEERINVAELLKYCPKGLELDCTVYNNIEFDHIDNSNRMCPIICRVQCSEGGYNFHTFTEYGCYRAEKYAKCVIFPKGKTTWEGFVPPCKFKDGDIVATNNGNWIGITTGGKKNVFIPTYCVIKSDGKFEAYFDEKEIWSFERLATEEEKQKLFDTIKANGYKWNAETKTLEELVKPKFKVGDKVIKKGGITIPVLITNVGEEFYSFNTEHSVGVFSIKEQDQYELVPNKFDITTLVPFESKVLVRDYDYEFWKPTFWGYRNNDNCKSSYTLRGLYRYCIPYEGNEHLLGTSDDCDEYFKTWE